ncbi:PP2C family protein-serine/threonine phosphatase [Leptolyngbya sp. NIES-2104]|uniref:PP2C family protein-serine/threonine phosphatase n=1 Tax=Leptolyngbya sp. NIES-2104 TaxID=1552121 RepID=UPI0006EC8BC8|nr:SpoIIE family protein phosphatase [Leptolyngbya sp. NIES-2104]GAP95174.1 serine phosphatase RsbU, regulator of sigma subunit [Leptolyngbya sp. NIES-2104]
MPPVLIIEDDRLVRKLLKKLLQPQGFEVVEATTGAEGLTLVSSVRPALILCDWSLPGIDGLSVCRTIKANPDWSDVYFILVAAYSSPEHHVKALDSGADDFLCKRIKIEELSARLRAGLRVYRAFQEQRRLAQELKLQQEQLETEMAEASEYVRSLLPAPMNDRIVARSQFLPSRQLGGDCFDYHWLDSEFFAMYLLDVSGHGLGAALVSVTIQNVLRAQILPGTNFYQPGLVLTALNEAFSSETDWLSEAPSDRYFTIWYGVYNYSKQLLMYASAGHPPAIVVSGHSPNHQIDQLRTPGTPIGMFADSKYKTQFFKVEQESTLYLFSDGIYEVQQSDGTIWNLDQFVDLIDRHHHSEQLDNLETIVRAVKDLKCDRDFDDDCSLLQIKLR